ncbi:PaaI family thioesterase [Nioella sp.]|uniref:PaaI family thioesterase n=1 Tax=Nioella sp. TaxID=1912091 RepID=UPI003512403C
MSAQDGKPEVPAPFNTLLGVRFVSWSEGHAELQLAITHDHLNGAFAVHGGVFATMLDNAVTFCAAFAGQGRPGHRCLTLSLTTSFVASAVEGDVLTARARLAGGGRKLVFVQGEILNQDGRRLAHGDAVIKRVTPPSGQPERRGGN